jgi:Rrf2 family cysteine metabolism transcriptional repressor
MMIEFGRESRKTDLVHLGKIAQTTGLSENYLAQLAMTLKNGGLLIGVSGKKGGYHLARPPDGIRIGEIIRAVIGPIAVTECVNHPEICLNSCFCETRMIWTIVNHRIQEALDEYTLADLIDGNWIDRTRKKYDDIPLLNPDLVLARMDKDLRSGCPRESDKI